MFKLHVGTRVKTPDGNGTQLQKYEDGDMFIYVLTDTAKKTGGDAKYYVSSDVTIKVCVQSATAQAFAEAPTTFNGLKLYKKAKGLDLLNRPEVYHDTIFRCMRKMRQDGLINYACIDFPKSKFQKILI